jgi:hypothetical protein
VTANLAQAEITIAEVTGMRMSGLYTTTELCAATNADLLRKLADAQGLDMTVAYHN